MRLRESYRKWEMDRISDSEMEKVYRDYTQKIIEEQEKAGLDVVTDGQLRWYDPISHFARKMEGCKIDGLLRYYDTNFYFRQPVVIGELSKVEPILKNEFLSAKDFATVTLKPVITGPYTLAKHSINEFYEDFSELIFNFAHIIGQEIEDLVKLGAKEIQINEPAILQKKSDFDIFSKAFNRLAGFRGDSQIDLALFFGDSTTIYEGLQELSADLLAFDFTYSDELTSLIEELGTEKKLGLGLINARNTRLEKVEEVAGMVRKIVPYINSDEIYLQPSCGVEFLPREIAFEKLKLLVKVKERVREVL
ncbi:hypothetical protein AKJ51_04320 [candidate division MSBL1 archaeon SCGC-AAA382A20]|uniref:Cobalamin-independent methionine synthase MetE C-terminal/archaeal domain-containing protein n=1 Tax=candidate division MSBL1 archaeon SCGC-AAA382A20 TaxID=1698280 RepID=A0A133VHX9_9EURY|nr:hypothetical protein AKJ51_04320 [candidate division MSBL1 archaeon SCGC-AAA382A20]